MRACALVLALASASCQRSPPGQLAPEASAFTADRRDTAGRASSMPTASELPSPPSRSRSIREHRASLRSRLQLTQGRFEGTDELTARVSKVRGIQADSLGDRASLRFRYEGPSAERRALRSGAAREQLGLKLRARDTCNLLYVMWRLAPESKLVVSIKVNLDQTSHDQCENHGYTNVRPEMQEEIPTLKAGQEHQLTAQIRGETLEATVDGRTVWRGRLPAEATKLSGPAGFRSDNVEWTLLDFEGDVRTE